MKKETHPRYYPKCKVYHNGQIVMEVGATVPELHVEVWSGSHPFFTGKQTFVARLVVLGLHHALGTVVLQASHSAMGSVL